MAGYDEGRCVFGAPPFTCTGLYELTRLYKGPATQNSKRAPTMKPSKLNSAS